ncbi:TPA: hypothetical protein RRM73_002771 [Staphylococcus argenteus]|nr:hypothetical protein [Staphylococcus argenteus]HDY9430685.1 hypothetical protein [Staphylococcus argenteus]HDY9437550.1 hypothetical protein [Staphylococcus argenteus]HDY9438999.1 hypothetical protein [Staphylococcus argenteus]HDY9443387.1 hypothetical protein [Staphylococcus argenteus]
MKTIELILMHRSLIIINDYIYIFYNLEQVQKGEINQKYDGQKENTQPIRMLTARLIDL